MGLLQAASQESVVMESPFYDDTWREMPCEIWPRCTNRDGYGIAAPRFGTRLAHVQTWVECFGPVPVGLRVLHKCDVPACRQPLHLWVGTQGDNARDRVVKGRSRGRFSGADRCIAGHLYTDPGVAYIRPDGARTCRICQRRRYHERKRLEAS